MSEPPKLKQLRMIWPEDRLNDLPSVPALEGYTLRQLESGDRDAYRALIKLSDLGDWDDAAMDTHSGKVIDGGFFVVIHDDSGDLVATTMANNAPNADYPEGGELGWVAGDPEHKGKGLGYLTCAAVTAFLLEHGYTQMYLMTDDFRLPAIKTYLKLGWVPDYYDDTMADRWKAVCEKLGWDLR